MSNDLVQVQSEKAVEGLATQAHKAATMAVELVEHGLTFPDVVTEATLAAYHSDFAAADECYNELHRYWKMGEDQRLEYTKPLNETLKKINNTFKARLDPLDAMKKSLKRKMEDGAIRELNWKRAEEDRKAKAEMKRLEDEQIARAAAAQQTGNVKKAEEIISRPIEQPKVEVKTAAQTAQSSTTFKWSMRVVSKRAFLQGVIDGKIDESLVEIDEAQVRKIVSASNGKIEFPGTKNFEDVQFGARAR